MHCQKNIKASCWFFGNYLDKLPQITCWKNDGGPFITLPVVYTEDIEYPGWMKLIWVCIEFSCQAINTYKTKK